MAAQGAFSSQAKSVASAAGSEQGDVRQEDNNASRIQDDEGDDRDLESAVRMDKVEQTGVKCHIQEVQDSCRAKKGSKSGIDISALREELLSGVISRVYQPLLTLK